jgi:hypothetical protein
VREGEGEEEGDLREPPLSPLPFAQISHSQISTLALLASATLIWVWDFVGDVDRAGERGGRERKRGAPTTLIGVWNFVGDVEGAGERGGFERRRISG